MEYGGQKMNKLDVKVDIEEFSLFSKKITVLSFIMSLGIVLYHIHTPSYFGLFPAQSALDKVCAGISCVIDSLAGISVCYFFMCSSFLLYYNLTKWNITAKVRKRVKSLLIPFILWNLIGLVIKWEFDIGIKEITRKIVLSQYCGIHRHY